MMFADSLLVRRARGLPLLQWIIAALSVCLVAGSFSTLTGDGVATSVQVAGGFDARLAASALILLAGGIAILLIMAISAFFAPPQAAVVAPVRDEEVQGADRALLDRLVRALSQLGDGVVLVSRSGAIGRVNRVAQGLLGISFGGITERSLPVIFANLNEDDRARMADAVARVFASGQTQPQAARARLRDGLHGTTPLEYVAMPVEDSQGRVLRVLLVLRDVLVQRRDAVLPGWCGSSDLDLLEDAGIGLRAVAADGTIVGASRAELDMLGYEHDEYVGQPQARFHADDGLHEEMMRRLRTGETLRGFESRMRCRDGSLRQVRIDARLCADDDGPFRIRALTRDVTVQCETEHRLAQLQAELQRADRLKDEFLAMLAHELRNPLAPILSALQVLEISGQNSPPAHQARAILTRQVGHMVRLIEDLLQVSRLTRNQLVLRCEPVLLQRVIEQAIEAVRPALDARKHALSVLLPAEAVWLDADAARLVQLFTNLLDNAARFTSRGGDIRVQAEAGDARVRISVVDTGMGITAPTLATVFELFAQADHSIERSSGGLGLGLTLARRLARLHGGDIEAFSAGLGQGSRFVVNLPQRDGPPADEAAAKPVPTVCTRSSDGLTEQALRVLVVDDNYDAAEALSTLLALMGHEVHVRHDGAQAVEAGLLLQPDVILLDIGLPVLNGYDAARRIRAQVGGGQIFMVALTGYGQADDRRRSAEAGFTYHLVKPVAPARLAELLAEARDFRNRGLGV